MLRHHRGGFSSEVIASWKPYDDDFAISTEHVWPGIARDDNVMPKLRARNHSTAFSAFNAAFVDCVTAAFDKHLLCADHQKAIIGTSFTMPGRSKYSA